MDKLKDINTSIDNLRVVLRSSNERATAYELNEIIKDTKDARSFIFLLDRFDTEKEITRETIEDLIECTYDFNGLVIEHIEKLNNCSGVKGVSFDIEKWLTWKHFKAAFFVAVFVGVISGVSHSEKLISSALSYVGIQIIKDDSHDTGDTDVDK